MTDEQRKRAIQIYDVLSSQKFSNWFGCPTDDADGYSCDYRTGGDFELHICADPEAPSKEEILQQIVEMFKL